MAGTITVDKIQSDTSYNSTINVVSALVVSNTATFANTTTHTGAATFANTLGVTGATTLSSTLAAGNTTITGTLATSGAATFANISSSGIFTMSSQPSFLAQNSTLRSNVTGSATTYHCIFDDVTSGYTFNIGSYYNASTGTFTAPITGKYLFWTFIGIEDIATNAAGLYVGLNTTLASFTINHRSLLGGTSIPTDGYGRNWGGGSMIVKMNAGNTAYIQLYEIWGNVTTDFSAGSFFGGMLIG